MKQLENVRLNEYTTFRVGGIAKCFYIPESVDDLISIIGKFGDEDKYYIISGGSNLLINDDKIYDNVICCKEFSQSIIYKGNGKFYVGASVRIQKLIKEIQCEGYGGIEYLYSVPAMVGGIITMNAGRGKGWHQAISDYVECVYVLKDGQVIKVAKEECLFGYRTSIFKESKDIVVAADFMFDRLTTEESEVRIKERMEAVKQTQDRGKPNFGSVFCVCNPRIMKWMQQIGLGNKRGVHFSTKTANWLVNEGEGTYKEARNLIRFVIILHKLFRKECRVEIQIWE